jgi:hypothetical protein
VGIYREIGLTPGPSPRGEGSRMKKPPPGLPEGRRVKSEKRIRDLRDLKGFGALRLKLYLELSFRILNKILCFNFK